MKKAFFTLVLFSLIAFAAAAQGPKYRTLVRNAEGQRLAEQSVGLKVSLLQFGIVYSETHTATTDARGLAELPVGKGRPTFGKFDTIRWEQRPTYIQISLAMDGANYEVMGSPELFNLPGAFYADNTVSAGATDTVLTMGAAGTMLTMGADGRPFWRVSELDSLPWVLLRNDKLIFIHPTITMSVEWGPYINITALQDSHGDYDDDGDYDGEANTAAIVAQLGNNNGTPYAAKICADLVAYGYYDWYLPTANELFDWRNAAPSELEHWSSSERDNNEAYFIQSESGLNYILPGDKRREKTCRCVRKPGY